MNPVFRTVEDRAHGMLGLVAEEKSALLILFSLVALTAGPLYGALAAVLGGATTLALRRLDFGRRDHWMLRWRRHFARRRCHPGAPDVSYRALTD